jgi:hypothetical protein
LNNFRPDAQAVTCGIVVKTAAGRSCDMNVQMGLSKRVYFVIGLAVLTVLFSATVLGLKYLIGG